MSHRHYWAKIERRPAGMAAAQLRSLAVGRNAEKLDVIVSNGSRSSSLGGPGERNLGENAK